MLRSRSEAAFLDWSWSRNLIAAQALFNNFLTEKQTVKASFTPGAEAGTLNRPKTDRLRDTVF